MMSLTRLQLLFAAYFILLCVGFEETIRDLLITHNFLQTWLHSFTNPINVVLLPIAFVVGWGIAQELDV